MGAFDPAMDAFSPCPQYCCGEAFLSSVRSSALAKIVLERLPRSINKLNNIKNLDNYKSAGAGPAQSMLPRTILGVPHTIIAIGLRARGSFDVLEQVLFRQTIFRLSGCDVDLLCARR